MRNSIDFSLLNLKNSDSNQKIGSIFKEISNNINNNGNFHLILNSIIYIFSHSESK